MRSGHPRTKLECMQTLISLCPPIVALIPLGMVLRALMAGDGPQTTSAAAAFYDGYGNPSTFPSLATLKALENTAPTFVKQSEWWTE